MNRAEYLTAVENNDTEVVDNLTNMDNKEFISLYNEFSEKNKDVAYTERTESYNTARYFLDNARVEKINKLRNNIKELNADELGDLEYLLGNDVQSSEISGLSQLREDLKKRKEELAVQNIAPNTQENNVEENADDDSPKADENTKENSDHPAEADEPIISEEEYNASIDSDFGLEDGVLQPAEVIEQNLDNMDDMPSDDVLFERNVAEEKLVDPADSKKLTKIAATINAAKEKNKKPSLSIEDIASALQSDELSPEYKEELLDLAFNKVKNTTNLKQESFANFEYLLGALQEYNQGDAKTKAVLDKKAKFLETKRADYIKSCPLKNAEFQEIANVMDNIEIKGKLQTFGRETLDAKEKQNLMDSFMASVREDTNMYLANTANPVTQEMFEKEYANRLRSALFEITTADAINKGNMTSKDLEKRFSALSNAGQGGKISINQDAMISYLATHSVRRENAAERLGSKDGYKNIAERFSQRLKKVDEFIGNKIGKERYEGAKKIVGAVLKSSAWSFAYGVGAAVAPVGLAVVSAARIVCSVRGIRKEFEKEKAQNPDMKFFRDYLKNHKGQLITTTLTAVAGVGSLGFLSEAMLTTVNYSRAATGLGLAVTSAWGPLKTELSKAEGWKNKLKVIAKMAAPTLAAFGAGIATGHFVHGLIDSNTALENANTSISNDNANSNVVHTNTPDSTNTQSNLDDILLFNKNAEEQHSWFKFGSQNGNEEGHDIQAPLKDEQATQEFRAEQSALNDKTMDIKIKMEPWALKAELESQGFDVDKAFADLGMEGKDPTSANMQTLYDALKNHDERLFNDANLNADKLQETMLADAKDDFHSWRDADGKLHSNYNEGHQPVHQESAHQENEVLNNENGQETPHQPNLGPVGEYGDSGGHTSISYNNGQILDENRSQIGEFSLSLGDEFGDKTCVAFEEQYSPDGDYLGNVIAIQNSDGTFDKFSFDADGNLEGYCKQDDYSLRWSNSIADHPGEQDLEDAKCMSEVVSRQMHSAMDNNPENDLSNTIENSHQEEQHIEQTNEQPEHQFGDRMYGLKSHKEYDFNNMQHSDENINKLCETLPEESRDSFMAAIEKARADGTKIGIESYQDGSHKFYNYDAENDSWIEAKPDNTHIEDQNSIVDQSVNPTVAAHPEDDNLHQEGNHLEEKVEPEVTVSPLQENDSHQLNITPEEKDNATPQQTNEDKASHHEDLTTTPDVHTTKDGITYSYDDKGHMLMQGKVSGSVDDLKPSITYDEATQTYHYGPIASKNLSTITNHPCDVMLRNIKVSDSIYQDMQIRQAGGETLSQNDLNFMKGHETMLSKWSLSHDDKGNLIQTQPPLRMETNTPMHLYNKGGGR